MAIEVFVNNLRNIAFVPVVDNLEQAIAAQLLDIGWQQTVLQTNYQKIFLVIDDPLIRWQRQVCRHYESSVYTNIGLDQDDFIDFLLYNKITCTNITNHQKYYFEQAKNFAKNVTLFQLTNKLGYMINHFLYDNGIPNKFNNLLKIDNEYNNYSKLKSFLTTDINKPYLDKVKNYLNNDLDFVESAKFYAR